ncbi:class I SAM-dependent methyltransferase [Dethiobacter alkaliphilus]|uniref:class I SAM-dependent methyltransferase n=1 Tax=Dethiobacter alkaliphilus TaxID=427926 RepID=UPI002226A63A|nr:class I SAM-dependent methyltransferase [Dethiobacter alkaliphilus]MCW3490106.1 methyltransferase domain-containing protein [Dethiobacter alkaliphilus]
MDTTTLFDSSFWESAWNEAIEADQERKRAKKSVDVWNRRAKNYDKNVDTDSGNRRVEEALAFLDTYGVMSEKLRILDLGCGPGNFTMAFAERGHQVVALDPAEEMLTILREKLAKRPDLEPLVKTVGDDWIPLVPQEYGWDNNFDLVFASMTPGVQDVTTLEKVMQVSGGYVYLSRFSGPRIHPSVQAVWEHFNDKPYYSQSLDILFPLNWLYAEGYKPAMHFARWERQHEQPAQEALEEMRNVLSLRMDIDRQVEQVMAQYVEAHSDENGLLSETKGATSAMLLWHVDKRVLTKGG